MASCTCLCMSCTCLCVSCTCLCVLPLGPALQGLSPAWSLVAGTIEPYCVDLCCGSRWLLLQNWGVCVHVCACVCVCARLKLGRAAANPHVPVCAQLYAGSVHPYIYSVHPCIHKRCAPMHKQTTYTHTRTDSVHPYIYAGGAVSCPPSIIVDPVIVSFPRAPTGPTGCSRACCCCDPEP